MGKPFQIKHGLECVGTLFTVDQIQQAVKIHGVRVATIDDLVGGGGSIGDINTLTTTNKSSIVGAINEVDASTMLNATDISTLENALTSEINSRILGDSGLASDLSTETAARIAADSNLQTQITSEASTRSTADGVLQQNITSEATTRNTQVTTLTTNLATEVYNREQGDINTVNTLTTLIGNEADTRLAMDAALQLQIDSIGAEITSFRRLELVADNYLDISLGSYIEVNPIGTHNIILPASIPNGGPKLTLENVSTVNSFNVLDSNEEFLFSVAPRESVNLVFDELNGFNHGRFTSNNDILRDNTPTSAQLGVVTNFAYQGNFHQVENYSKDIFLNVVYDNSLNGFYLRAHSKANASEIASALVNNLPIGTAHSFRVFDEKIIIAYSNTIKIYELVGTALPLISSELLSVGGSPILDVEVIDEFNFLFSTSTAAERRVYHYVANNDYTVFTLNANTPLNFVFNTNVDYAKLIKFNEVTFGVAFVKSDAPLSFGVVLFSKTGNTFTLGTTYHRLSDAITHLNVVGEDTLVYTAVNALSSFSFTDLNFGSSFVIDNLSGAIFRTAFAPTVALLTTTEVYPYRYGVLLEQALNSFKYGIFRVHVENKKVEIKDTGVYSYTTLTDHTLLDFFVDGVDPIVFLLLGQTGSTCKLLRLDELVSDSYKIHQEDYSFFGNVNSVTGRFDYLNVESAKIEIMEADYFIGDGSKLTGIPGGYDQSLNTTDSVIFANVQATQFIGDGSLLTGLPAGSNQTLNIGDNVTFGTVTASQFIGLPEGIKVFQIIAGEGSVNPTPIEDRIYTFPEGGTGWHIGRADIINGSSQYGIELGTSTSDLIVVHPKGVPPFMVKLMRNKNKGFPAGMGIQDLVIGWKANIANTAIRIDLFPLEEYEYWIQIVFL